MQCLSQVLQWNFQEAIANSDTDETNEASLLGLQSSPIAKFVWRPYGTGIFHKLPYEGAVKESKSSWIADTFREPVNYFYLVINKKVTVFIDSGLSQ